MAKAYIQMSNRKNYVKNAIITKIKTAIKSHKNKKYILIKKVISEDDAQACILNVCRKKFDRIQNNRLFDRYICDIITILGVFIFLKFITSLYCYF